MKYSYNRDKYRRKTLAKQLMGREITPEMVFEEYKRTYTQLAMLLCVETGNSPESLEHEHREIWRKAGITKMTTLDEARALAIGYCEWVTEALKAWRAREAPRG